jgi:hypothetical protein
LICSTVFQDLVRSLTTRKAAGLPLEEGDNRLLSASDKEPMAVNK